MTNATLPDGWEAIPTKDRELLEKYAARYNWLRAGNAYRPEEWNCTGGDELDQFVDESIEEESVRVRPD